MTAAAFVFLVALLDTFRYPSFSVFARAVIFLLVVLLAIFAVNTLNNNYPDTPVAGAQKKMFNRLFLLNFIFLAFLFGFTLSEFRDVKRMSAFSGRPISDLPFGMLLSFLIHTLILTFQLIILYGLYELRRLLYSNFSGRNMFEFENDRKSS